MGNLIVFIIWLVVLGLGIKGLVVTAAYSIWLAIGLVIFACPLLPLVGLFT